MSEPTRYPVILNGDHAEFEAEHRNTPPKERPDWPLPSFDARDWAEAFCKIAKSKGLEIDEHWMVTWFSNALMRGFDENAKRNCAERDQLKAEVAEAKDNYDRLDSYCQNLKDALLHNPVPSPQPETKP